MSDLETLRAELRIAGDRHDVESLERIAETCRQGDAQVRALGASAAGTAAMHAGRYEQALKAYVSCLDLERDLGDLVGESIALTNIGTVLFLTAAYPEALEYFNRALEIDEKIGDERGLAFTLSSIGNALEAARDPDAALEHHLKAYEIYQRSGDEFGVGNCVANIGNTYLAIGQFEEALDWYQQSLGLFEQLESQTSIGLILGNMAHALIDLGRYDEAGVLLDRFSAIDNTDPMSQAGLHILRAKVFRGQNMWDKASSEFDRALEIASQHGLRRQVAEAHKEFRELAKLTQNLNLYIEHNDKYLQMNEEIRGSATVSRLAVLNTFRGLEALRQERLRERSVLHATLPKEIADRMLQGDSVSGDHHDSAVVLFLDIVNFTALSSERKPAEVVQLLGKIFTMLDSVIQEHGLMKVKTIGDSYLAVGLNSIDRGQEDLEAVVKRAAMAAVVMIRGTRQSEADLRGIEFRIGLHIGPVTSGVIGTDRLQFDIWGEGVSTAERLEGTSEPGRIQVSESFARALCVVPSATREVNQPLVARDQQLRLIPKGEVELAGNDVMTTFWLEEISIS